MASRTPAFGTVRFLLFLVIASCSGHPASVVSAPAQGGWSPLYSPTRDEPHPHDALQVPPDVLAAGNALAPRCTPRLAESDRVDGAFLGATTREIAYVLAFDCADGLVRTSVLTSGGAVIASAITPANEMLQRVVPVYVGGQHRDALVLVAVSHDRHAHWAESISVVGIDASRKLVVLAHDDSIFSCKDAPNNEDLLYRSAPDHALELRLAKPCP
jgi:hypothetical protein